MAMHAASVQTLHGGVFVWLRLLLAWLLIACGVSCHGRPKEGATVPSAAPGASSLSRLAERVEIVAQADALALEGSKKSGAEGARLAERAAELRVRLWRTEHRQADALEAIELYRALEQRPAVSVCDMALDRAVLEGELENDPEKTYKSVYLARVRGRGSACAARAERVLDTLAAFRPLPSVLGELDRQGGLTMSASPRASGSAGDARGPVVVPMLAADAPRGPARIGSIERYGAEDAARIVVRMSHPTTFEVGAIAEQAGRGPRLYVDIHNAGYHGALNYDVGGLIERVRLGRRGDGTRLVLDLKAQVYRRVFYLPEPFRLVVDVSTQPPAAPESSARGPRVLRRIVLDPGHGGHDPGAVGPSGLKEKDVTLDLAHRAAPLLARELGVATLLTRDSDDFVALDERAAKANAFQADLFISIHSNASEDGQGRGVMTFVLDDSRDAAAALIAARENAASPAAARELANVLQGTLDATSLQRSLHFAELLQRSAIASLGVSYADEPDRGVKRAGFYVLAGARMPAVLFEGSFISDPTTELRLNTTDYRQKLADAIVNACRAYRDGR
jgi:N-acetylmuramoyl-L-alanine amidase